MNKNSYMTISEFAKFTGIKRSNLIFYDNIGLISPEFRKENGYRFYTQRQLPTAFLIISLREMGIDIDTIKKYTHMRTPMSMMELFTMQEKKIDDEIQSLKQLKGIMRLYNNITAESLRANIDSIQLQDLPSEPIFWGPDLPEGEPYSEERLIEFYDYAEKHGLPLSYPFGTLISKKALLEKRFDSPSKFYFRLPSSKTQFKPAGSYVVGYIKGDFSKAELLYPKMLDFIEKNNLTICGDAYEEYPLSEISVSDENEYLIRIAILVER